jgi:hypothetical protein
MSARATSTSRPLSPAPPVAGRARAVGLAPGGGVVDAVVVAGFVVVLVMVVVVVT